MISHKAPRYFARCDAIALPTEGENYEPHTAWWLAQCSWLAYDSKPNIAKYLSMAGFDRVYYFDMRGTQGFLTLHPGGGKRFAILAFRGTEKDYVDILTDIIILRRKLPDLEDKESGEGPFFAHAGFSQAFQAVWGSALPDVVKNHITEAEWIGPPGISNLIQEKICRRQIPLFVTGHSLGGAIATLAAYHAYTHHPHICLYTFGSPRVANGPLGEKIGSVLRGRSYRCVHGLDVVARVPPLLDYTHVHQLVYFDSRRGRVPAKGNMANDGLVILLLHLDALLLLLTFKLRKPQTTKAHTIASYIKVIEREPLKPREITSPASFSSSPR
jgi:hypothetical protein